MSTSKKFIPVILTPFHQDGSIDYEGLSALTAYYIEAGAGGLFANCLSSEMYELSSHERLDITAHVVRAAAGAVPVFSTGTFSANDKEQADFVKRIYETGASAVIVISSILVNEAEPDALLEDRFHQLLDNTGNIPLGFYECPVPYKRLLKAEQLQRFVSTGRVVYHKDTSLNIDAIKAKLAATSGYPFELYDAYMVNAVASLRAGAAGLSCIQGNYIPELISWLCDNFDNNELQGDVQLAQQFLTRNMDVMHEVYPVAAKYFLQKRGVPIGLTTRRQGNVFSGNARGGIDRLFESYQALQHSIGFRRQLTG